MVKLPLVIDDTNATLYTHGVLGHRICVFGGDSGTGKTYLFSRLRDYFLESKYSSKFVRLSQTLSFPINLSEEFNFAVDVLLVDNGDLIPMNILISALSKCPAKLILVTNRGYAIPRSDDIWVLFCKI